jgi:DoxX-like family
MDFSIATTYVIITVVTVLATAAAAIADLARADFVVANAREVGVPQTRLTWLAAPKAAAAVGLLLGLGGVRVLGTAAAAGLVLFFLGAIAAHIRAHVYHDIALPTVYLALALASLALAVAEGRA